MLLKAENLHLSYGTRTLLDNESLVLQPRERIALVGINGCGKSSLLRELEEHKDASGSVELQSGAIMARLRQHPEFEKETIWEQMTYTNAKSAFPKEEYELKTVLTKLGLDDFDKRIEECSGGMKRRLDLAQTLVKDADILLLDEPTNHLDPMMIEWLENWLKRSTQAILFVSHDRYFLDSVCTGILELRDGHLKAYQGNYAAYLEASAENRKIEWEQNRKLENLYRKELAWVRAGVQARSTKSKSRLDRFEELRSKRKKQRESGLSLDLGQTRLGKKSLEWKNVEFGYDRVLFHDFSWLCARDARIGLTGVNGSGKSTFLKLLAGELEPDQGIIERGGTVVIGHYRQDHQIDQSNLTVMEYITQDASSIDLPKQSLLALQMLERFQFDNSQFVMPVSSLSGGEQKRLYLLSVLMKHPNVLLLDEPTNDLDIQTLEILEDFLDDFDGTVITVSHDRYFLDRVCDEIFLFEKGKVPRRFSGGYSSIVFEKENPFSKPNEGSNKGKRVRQAISLSYKEKRRKAELESLMEEAENRISEIDQKMDGLQDYEAIEKLSNERSDLCEKQEEYELEWMELEEKEEKFARNA